MSFMHPAVRACRDPGELPGADEQLTRVQIARAGKAATALVEVRTARGDGYATAFCIHPAGWFLTNAHVAQRDLNLILNPSLKTEKSYSARVIRSDQDLDLALLHVEGAHDLPALVLGSDDDLEDLMEVIGFGFPFGKALAPGKHTYPAISVNVGSITSLRRRDGQLERIQLDAALNPGNSGGPVLDKGGKVIGVVVAGVRGSGINFAVPVSVVSQFLAQPEVQFNPPSLGPETIHQPVRFELRVTPLLHSKYPVTVDLILKSVEGSERTTRMQAEGERYHATVVPIPPKPGPWTLRLTARYKNGTLEASTAERSLRIGGRDVKLSDVRVFHPGSTPRLVLRDGETITGAVAGLDAVSVRLGEQMLSVDLGSAKELNVSPEGDSDQVGYTLVVRHGDKEIYRQSQGLTVAGLPVDTLIRVGDYYGRWHSGGAKFTVDKVEEKGKFSGRVELLDGIYRVRQIRIYRGVDQPRCHQPETHQFRSGVQSRGTRTRRGSLRLAGENLYTIHESRANLRATYSQVAGCS